MKRTARKYPPSAASKHDDLLLLIGGIVIWGLMLMAAVKVVSAILNGDLVWTG